MIQQKLPNDISSLITQDIYMRTPRENITLRSTSDNYGPSEEIVFSFSSGRDYKDYYTDLRGAFLQFDIVGTNPISEIAQEQSLTRSSVPSSGTFVPAFGDYKANSILAHNSTFGDIANVIQAQIMVPYYPGLTIVAINSVANFTTAATANFSITGFDFLDIGIPYQNDLKVWLALNNMVDATPAPVTVGISLPNSGSVSTPRLGWNSSIVISRAYASLGTALFNINSLNILENILTLTDNVNSPDSFRFTRSLTRYGLPIINQVRVQVPLQSFGIFQQLILPPFIKNGLELRFTTETAIRALVRENTTQEYRITNAEINYHRISLPTDVCEAVYKTALKGNLNLLFTAWDNDTTQLATGTSKFSEILQYGYKNLMGVCSVLHEDNIIIDDVTEVNNHKLDTFIRNGILSYRLELGKGQNYPIDDVRNLNGPPVSIAESQLQFMKMFDISYYHSNRFNNVNTCWGFLNNLGDNFIFSPNLNRKIPPSYVIAVNTKDERGDAPPQIKCVSGASMQGYGSDNRLLITNMSPAPSPLTVYTYMKYCGRIHIKPDLTAQVYY